MTQGAMVALLALASCVVLHAHAGRACILSVPNTCITAASSGLECIAGSRTLGTGRTPAKLHFDRRTTRNQAYVRVREPVL